MTTLVKQLMLAHPASVNESYFQHMRFALGFSGRLVLAACAAFIHALVPAAFEKTAGNMVRQMYGRICNR